jgi:hypothetical protein
LGVNQQSRCHPLADAFSLNPRRIIASCAWVAQAARGRRKGLQKNSGGAGSAIRFIPLSCQFSWGGAASFGAWGRI